MGLIFSNQKSTYHYIQEKVIYTILQLRMITAIEWLASSLHDTQNWHAQPVCILTNC